MGSGLGLKKRPSGITSVFYASLDWTNENKTFITTGDAGIMSFCSVFVEICSTYSRVCLFALDYQVNGRRAYRS